MIELALLTMGNDRRLNLRSGLAGTIRSVDVDEVADAYRQTVEAAPRRYLQESGFFVGHGGGGEATNIGSEKVRAKAIFNSASPLTVGDARVQILDYEVPLRGMRSDTGVGEIDLFGVEVASGRTWIIELKVFDNSDTPLKALFQCLRYGAIVEANWKAIADEAAEKFDVEFRWPPVLCVAADTAYWDKLMETKRAGDWLEALKDLIASLSKDSGFETCLLDLGDLRAELSDDGRARLVGPVTVTEL